MIKKITLEESDLWNQIVSTFEKRDIYYTAEHARLYKIHGDGEPILIYYYDEFVRAINVVMVRDIATSGLFSNLPRKTYYDIATPYGYGGMLIQGSQNYNSLQQLKRDYIQFCRDNGIICEFARFHPILENYNNTVLYQVSEVGPSVTIQLDLKSRIRENYEASKRNDLKRAKKFNLRTVLSNDMDLIDSFIPLYYDTMTRDGAKDYYYFGKEYFESLFQNLKENVFFAYVKNDSEIIAMAIFFFYDRKIHYHLSASKNEFSNLSPTNLLIDYVAHWGSEHGFSELVLGGGLGGKEDSLFRFKRKFNKNFNRKFYIGQRIFDKEKYDKLVSLRGANIEGEESTYFPKYRQPLD